MDDLLKFRATGDACHRQFGAREKLYAYLRSRWNIRNFDCSIEPNTGVVVLDMNKPYELWDVVQFKPYPIRTNTPANDR